MTKLTADIPDVSKIENDALMLNKRSWRWYNIDLGSGILQNLITNEKVIVIINDHSITNGVAIINKYNNVFQICYLDTFDALTLEYLVRFAFELANTEKTNRCEILQIFSPQISCLQPVMGDLGIDESGQFLLYRRNN